MHSELYADAPAVASRSLVDRFLSKIYTRSQRNRTNTDKDLRALTVCFQLRRLARKWRLGSVPIRIVFLASEPHGWFSMHSLYHACINDPAFEVTVVSVGWGPWKGFSSDCEGLF